MIVGKMLSRAFPPIQSLLLMLICFTTTGCRHDSSVAVITKSPKEEPAGRPFIMPQQAKFHQEQLDNTRGLSNSSVNCIFRDSQNLMWIGTWDGLNRYDGSTFRIFRPEPDNKNSLSNQVVLKVGEDGLGDMWILTMHGINRYNKANDTFTHYYFSRANTPPVSESEFNMALDPEGQVFCTVRDWGLSFYSGNSFKKVTGKAIRNGNVRKMEFLSAGRLLLLYEDNRLEVANLEKDAAGTWSVKSFSGAGTGIRSFEVLPEGLIATVATNGNATLLNTNSGNRISLASGGETIYGWLPGAVAIGTKSGFLLSGTAGQQMHLPWTKFLENHKVTTITKGAEDVIWCGTDGDGIIKIYPLKKAFNLVSKNQIPELDGGITRAFLKDSGSFWVATKGKGLLRVKDDFYISSAPPGVLGHFDENNSPLHNSVYSLAQLQRNTLLIGTDGPGITLYDGATERFISWKEIEDSRTSPNFRSVYAIYVDEKGIIWLGTNGYGLIRLELQRTASGFRIVSCRQYLAGGNTGSLSSNIIFSIVPKDQDHLWVGTRLGGLNLLDTRSGTFTSFKNNSAEPGSLANNDILSMAIDSKQRLWIGTSFGLSMLSEVQGDTAKFINYTVKEGLPNNTIHGIVPAGNSTLWLSTNMGLSQYNWDERRFTNYTRSEGLQNNEFADGAVYCDRATGTIFMGGIKGFNYFVPEQIQESPVLPDLFIDRISGHNQAVPYYQNLVIPPNATQHPSLVLKHNQNFFDIYLSTLTYINTEKCQYAYQLKGFDKSWNTIDNRKIISFTNVPQGNYSLLLKWSNSDGVWTPPVHAIDIRISPVWWQSNLAIIIYVVLGVLFLLFVRSYYLKKQSLAQTLLIRQKEEELHENRLSFFTNIAHEFLTPLTLIVGPAQKMAESTAPDARSRKHLHMIQRNASRLLFLTQQLLEFRKAEYDYLENTVHRFDLVNLVEQIAELFDDWALDKNITYEIDIPASLNGWYDKDKVEKIIFNLMSNAFKYTPAKGSIRVSFRVEPGDVKRLNITISNSGEGIPEQKLESLFDRFFLADAGTAADTETFRTGIGLAYIKKLVTVLRGEIKVSSKPGEQTVFTVLLPCSRSAFTDNEINTDSATVLVSKHLKNIVEEAPGQPLANPEKIAALEAAEDTRHTVLVVEDEKDVQEYLCDLLSGSYRLMTAANGAEALELIERHLPDIIVSDVMMPVMDGVDLCKNVKTNLRTCHIPFIMLTAKSSVQHRIEGLEVGANSYIPKPFYPDHLLVRIQKLLEEKELILKHFTQDTFIQEPTATAGKDEKAFTKQVVELIRNNLENEKLDSNFLEQHLGISESQFYRKVKELFGMAPGDLIRTLRLKYAAELLRRNELTVSEVCYKSGFNNRSYFYREFKKVYDTTPKSYQLNYKSKQDKFVNN